MKPAASLLMLVMVCGPLSARAAKPLLERIEIAKQAADLCSGMLDQSIVDELVAGGELPSQIARVRAFYRGKRGVMIAALEEHFADKARWTSADGQTPR